ncbi:hypothetical protein [Acinetobacter gerneri]|uniref:hypothetical protein n=1 Tax=Acinetobacter gerneri TaxID=202952 RepID=UPI00321217BE
MSFIRIGLLSTPISLIILIQGCGWTVSPLGSSPEYLLNSKGEMVRDCESKILSKKSPGTEYFWEKNNLPKGTTEFTCIDGKAYLKGEEPK